MAVEATVNLLKSRGVQVSLLMRNSSDIARGLSGKLQAFVSGIYSLSAYSTMAQLIDREHPDIIHVHNVYPLLSPSVLVACRRHGVPVVMTCHTYRLTCPIGVHFRGGKICERCCDGREYWCVLKNCRRNIFESTGYALRSAVARKLRLFADNVTLFIAVSQFIKSRLIHDGFKDKQIAFLPNMVHIPGSRVDPVQGKYVAYVGRFSPEKGIDTLLAAAHWTRLPVRLAGDYSEMLNLVKMAPQNAQFIGQLNRGQLVGFYRNARFLVVPSLCFETFGLTAAEAMSHGLPVIASRIGGLPEIVEDGVTGILFEPGNAKVLAHKMKLLWENPDLCRRTGQAGREKAIREYSEDVYYKRLMAVYEKALALNTSI